MTARILVLTCIFPFLMTTEAHAYLDPGTGSYLIQVLIAGVLGAAFAVKTFWRNIKSSVARLAGRKKPEHDSAG